MVSKLTWGWYFVLLQVMLEPFFIVRVGEYREKRMNVGCGDVDKCSSDRKHSGMRVEREPGLNEGLRD